MNMKMLRYKVRIPRVRCGLMGLAMTAITLGVLIVAPATVDAETVGACNRVASEQSRLASARAIVDSAIKIVESDIVASNDIRRLLARSES